MPRKYVNVSEFEKYTHALIVTGKTEFGAFESRKPVLEIACGLAIVDRHSQVAVRPEDATCPTCRAILAKRVVQRKADGR